MAGKNLGDFATETAGLGEQVPILVNGLPVHNIFKDRTPDGDLRVNLHVEGMLPAAASEEQQKENDPESLTKEEREELKTLEKLGGVRGGPVAPNLGDNGSEDDAL